VDRGPRKAVIGTFEREAAPETGAGSETLPLERSRLTTKMEPDAPDDQVRS